MVFQVDHVFFCVFFFDHKLRLPRTTQKKPGQKATTLLAHVDCIFFREFQFPTNQAVNHHELPIYHTKHFRYLNGGTHLFKLYGYGLCKGKPTPKIAIQGSVPPFLVNWLLSRVWAIFHFQLPFGCLTGSAAQKWRWGLFGENWDCYQKGGR